MQQQIPVNSFDTESPATQKETDWQSLPSTGGLAIYRPLFEKGVGVVTTPPPRFHCKKEPKTEPAKESVSWGQNHAQEKQIAKIRKLLAPLQSQGAALKTINPNAVVCNHTRRDECFVPVIYEKEENGKLQQKGFYAYFWMAKNPKNQPSEYHIDRVVTCGCMFGSGLKGITNSGSLKALIKHDGIYLPDEKIREIDFNPDQPSLYENVQFAEFDQYAAFVNKLLSTGSKREMFYHLPTYDYMLFGIGLFVNGKMTLSALNDFLVIIGKRGELHQQILGDICATYKINVKFVSPFENLFCYPDFPKNLSDYLNSTELAENILTNLGLSATEDKYPIFVKKDKNHFSPEEQQAVQSFLERLKTNTFNEQQRILWKDLSETQTSRFNDIESLFGIGNSLVPCIATSRGPNLTTCIIEPKEEKEIQRNYQEYLKKLYACSCYYIANSDQSSITALINKLSTQKQAISTHAFIFTDSEMFYLYDNTHIIICNDKQVLDNLRKDLSITTVREKELKGKELEDDQLIRIGKKLYIYLNKLSNSRPGENTEIIKNLTLLLDKPLLRSTCRYANSLNITVFDPLKIRNQLTLNPRASTFYADNPKLAKIIKKYGLISALHSNVANCALNQEPVPLSLSSTTATSDSSSQNSPSASCTQST